MKRQIPVKTPILLKHPGRLVERKRVFFRVGKNLKLAYISFYGIIIAGRFYKGSG